MEDLEQIVNVDNEFIAGLMDSILTERNIPHILRTFHDSAYDGLWVNQQGWGVIEASPEYRDEIIKIYKEVTKEPK